MHRIAVRIALFCALATSAQAAPWQVDAAHSTLSFTGTQAGDKFEGSFKKFTPVIDFDPKHPETGHIEVTVDMGSAEIKNDKDKQESLPTDTWFAVKSFPTAVFRSTRIAQVGNDSNTYIAEGELTLRGVAKPVMLSFALEAEGKFTRAIGSTTLNRQDFGIGQGKEWESDQWIAYPVAVKFTVLASQ